jgi:hypothetical protein
LYRLEPGVLDVFKIVRPETAIRWHRTGFRAYWRWKSRPRSGRPKTPLEIRQLIREMRLANPLWGAPRMHGELLKLGIDVGQTTVAKYMARGRRPPSQGWKTFLHNHADGIASMDPFAAPTISFRLLYSPAEEPDYEDDWLLDIRLYSRSFRADRASILLLDLGLANQHLRTHIADRRKFFDAKDRFRKIKGLVAPDDTAADIDRKMIAVVTKADQPELFNILRTVFHAWAEAGADIDLDDLPVAWANVEKFDLDGPFWQMVRRSDTQMSIRP